MHKVTKRNGDTDAKQTNYKGELQELIQRNGPMATDSIRYETQKVLVRGQEKFICTVAISAAGPKCRGKIVTYTSGACVKKRAAEQEAASVAIKYHKQFSVPHVAVGFVAMYIYIYESSWSSLRELKWRCDPLIACLQESLKYALNSRIRYQRPIV